MTINFASPANCKIFLSYILAIVSLQLIDTDTFFEEYLKLDETTPLSDNWENLGYGSLYSIKNFGIQIFVFVGWPIMMMLAIFLSAVIKVKSMQPVLAKMRNFFIFNGPVTWLFENYIQIAACCCINSFYFKWDSYGNILNSCFTIVCGIICFVFPIFVGCHYSKQFSFTPLDKEKFGDKWGTLTQALNLKRRGKKALWFPVCNLVRKLILILASVFLQN